jgi:hypothetical protein
MAMFNPNTVLPLPGEGTVYLGAIVLGDWGRLEIREGGALLDPDWSRARVAAPDRTEPGPDGVLAGPGWTLTLSPGWTLVPAPRPGDLELRRAD